MKRFNVIFAGLMSFGVVLGLWGMDDLNRSTLFDLEKTTEEQDSPLSSLEKSTLFGKPTTGQERFVEPSAQQEIVRPIILITMPSQAILKKIQDTNESNTLPYFKKNPQFLTNAMSYLMRHAGESKDTKELAVKSLGILSKMSSQQQKGTFSTIISSVKQEQFNGFFADHLIKSALTSYDEKQFPKDFELKFSEEMKKDEILEQLKKQLTEFKRLKESGKRASIEWLRERKKLLEQYLELSPEDEIYQKDLEKVVAAIETHEKREILTKNINQYGRQLKGKSSPELLGQYLQALEEAERAYPNTERAETIKNIKLTLELRRKKTEQVSVLLPFPLFQDNIITKTFNLINKALEASSEKDLLEALNYFDKNSQISKFQRPQDLTQLLLSKNQLFDLKKALFDHYIKAYIEALKNKPLQIWRESSRNKGLVNAQPKQKLKQDWKQDAIKDAHDFVCGCVPPLLNSIFTYQKKEALSTLIVAKQADLSIVLQYLQEQSQSLASNVLLIQAIAEDMSFSVNEKMQACLMLLNKSCSFYPQISLASLNDFIAEVANNYSKELKTKGLATKKEVLVGNAVKSLDTLASVISLIAQDISGVTDEDLKDYLKKVEMLQINLPITSKEGHAKLRTIFQKINEEVKKREDEASAAASKVPERKVEDLEASMLPNPTLPQTSINSDVSQIPFEEKQLFTSLTPAESSNPEPVKPDPHSGHPVSAETPQIQNDPLKSDTYIFRQKATVRSEIKRIEEYHNDEMLDIYYNLSDSAKQVMTCVINLAKVIEYADDDDRKAIIEFGKNNLLFRKLANNLHIASYKNGAEFKQAINTLKESIEGFEILSLPPRQSSGGVINPSNPSGASTPQTPTSPQTSATPPPSTPQKPISMTTETGSNNSATPMTTQPTTVQHPKEQQQGWFSYYITSPISSIWNGVKSMFNWLGSWIPRFGG